MWHRIRLNVYNGWTDFDDTWPDSDFSCVGHFSYSSTPFKNIFDDNNTVYSNEVLYGLLNPTRGDYPYVYDSFAWRHCRFLGKFFHYVFMCMYICIHIYMYIYIYIYVGLQIRSVCVASQRLHFYHKNNCFFVLE